MAGITQDQRTRAWNVHFVGGLRTFAGIYQRDGVLTVADVARELDMCLQFSRPQGAWHAILLPLETSRTSARDPSSTGDPSDVELALTIDNEPFILLDTADSRAFPTPATGYCTKYRYAFHSSSCSDPRHSGSTGMLRAQPTSTFSHPFPYNDACLLEPGTPSRRYDPRYLSIGKKDTDERLGLVHVWRSTKRKASSSGSSRTSSRAPSPSTATRDANLDFSSAEIPTEIIPAKQARYIISKFRTNVLTGGATCAITGKGESWLGNSIGGPGVEVAHIIPQCHWTTYPMKVGQGIADRDARSELEEAWRCTWASPNGLPLLSHLHKCFESRLIAIHPTTHRIRTFAWYDIMNDYHGQKAKIPPGIDPNALRHHWDMCCLENLVAVGIPNAPVVSSASIPPAMQSLVSISSTGPQGTVHPPTSTREDNGASPAASGQPPSGTKNNQHSPSHTAAHPPSPPSSDTVGCRDPQLAESLTQIAWNAQEVRPAGDLLRPERIWMVGNEVIKDPQLAERLRLKGWNVRELHKEERPRPHKRRRSIPRWRVGAHLIDNEYEAQRLRDQGWIVEQVEQVDKKPAVEDDDGPVQRGRPSKRRSTFLEEAEDDGGLGDDRPLKRRSTLERAPDPHTDTVADPA